VLKHIRPVPCQQRPTILDQFYLQLLHVNCEDYFCTYLMAHPIVHIMLPNLPFNYRYLLPQQHVKMIHPSML